MTRPVRSLVDHVRLAPESNTESVSERNRAPQVVSSTVLLNEEIKQADGSNKLGELSSVNAYKKFEVTRQAQVLLAKDSTLFFAKAEAKGVKGSQPEISAEIVRQFERVINDPVHRSLNDKLEISGIFTVNPKEKHSKLDYDAAAVREVLIKEGRFLPAAVTADDVRRTLQLTKLAGIEINLDARAEELRQSDQTDKGRHSFSYSYQTAQTLVKAFNVLKNHDDAQVSLARNLTPDAETTVEITAPLGENAGLSFETTTSLSSLTPDPGLKNFSTLTTEVQVSGFAEFESEGSGHLATKPKAKPVPLTVDGKLFAGARLTVESKISKEEANRLASGQSAMLPNPFKPIETIPNGSGIVIKLQSVAGQEQSLAHKNIALEAGVSGLTGIGIGVERLDKSKVRITTGLYSGVENEVFFGADLGFGKLGINNEKSLEDARLRTATLDLATKEGINAYHRLLLTGKVPAERGEGISENGNIKLTSFKDVTSLTGGGSLGIVAGEQRNLLAAAVGQQKITTLTDGSGLRQEEISLSWIKDRTLYIQKSFDQKGKEYEAPDTPKYNLVFKQVNPSDATLIARGFAAQGNVPEQVRRLYPAAGKSDAAQDVQVSWSSDQVKQIQRRAQEYLRQANGLPANAPLKQDNRNGLRGDSVVKALAFARDTDQAAIIIARSGDLSTTANVIFDLRFGSAASTNTLPLPGTVKFQNSPNVK